MGVTVTGPEAVTLRQMASAEYHKILAIVIFGQVQNVMNVTAKRWGTASEWFPHRMRTQRSSSMGVTVGNRWRWVLRMLAVVGLSFLKRRSPMEALPVEAPV